MTLRIGLLGTIVNPLQRVVKPELLSALSADIELFAVPSRVHVFPATPVERAMQAIGHLDAGFTAERAGCVAAVIDSAGDYGLAALKAGLGIPIVGAGEAGMAAAGADGRRFAVVTVWPFSMNFLMEDLLVEYGYRNQCVAIRNAGIEDDLNDLSGPDGYLERVRQATSIIRDRVVGLCEAAIVDGAEAILLGCTCMSALASDIGARVRIPVINPLLAGILAAAQKARSAQKTAEPLMKPNRVDLVCRMVDAIASEEKEDCPVCVIA